MSHPSMFQDNADKALRLIEAGFTADEVRAMLGKASVAQAPVSAPPKPIPVVNPPGGSCGYEWGSQKVARVRHLSVAPTRPKHYCREDHGHQGTHVCVCGSGYGTRENMVFVPARRKTQFTAEEVTLTRKAAPTPTQEREAIIKANHARRITAGDRDAAKQRPRVDKRTVPVKCFYCERVLANTTGRAAHVAQAHPEHATPKQLIQREALKRQSAKMKADAEAGIFHGVAKRNVENKAAGIKSPVQGAALEMQRKKAAGEAIPLQGAALDMVRRKEAGEPIPAQGFVLKRQLAKEPLTHAEEVLLAEAVRVGQSGATLQQMAKAASITYQRAEHLLEGLLKRGLLKHTINGGHRAWAVPASHSEPVHA